MKPANLPPPKYAMDGDGKYFNMNRYYKLNENKEPVPVDLFEWANVMNGERHVGNDFIGDIHVSTVFLGLNHQYGDGPPLLFETMIFGGDHDNYQERYCTWAEAEEGHKRAVALVNSDNTTPPPQTEAPAQRDERSDEPLK